MDIDFYFGAVKVFYPPQRKYHLFFYTKKSCVCYWKSICTFLGNHLLSEIEALQLFSSLFCCQ